MSHADQSAAVFTLPEDSDASGAIPVVTAAYMEGPSQHLVSPGNMNVSQLVETTGNNTE